MIRKVIENLRTSDSEVLRVIFENFQYHLPLESFVKNLVYHGNAIYFVSAYNCTCSSCCSIRIICPILSVTILIMLIT